MIDLDAARSFLDTHARLLDSRVAALLLDSDDERDRAAATAALLTALAAYRNPDGGFGWALEPDLRAAASQPVGALEALELLARVAPATSPLAGPLCDWLGAVALDGGALPFSLPGADTPGTAPWWAKADPAEPSLHLTSAILSAAQHVARHDETVAAHPWLARATDWCLRAIADKQQHEPGYELMYVLRFLEALALREDVPESDAAHRQLARLAPLVPPSGAMRVHAGSDAELLRLLDLSQFPATPLRALLDPAAVEAALAELEAGQREDGGWTVDFPSSSPAGAIEWRGIATVRALACLREHGRI